MNKFFFHLLIVVFLSAFQSCHEKSDECTINCKSYSETRDPVPVPESTWDQVSSGLHASVGSAYVRYPKHQVPVTEIKNTWKGSGWKGERVAAQLILWSADSVRQVLPEFSDFRSENGHVMPASIAEARFVRYVITDEFAGGCGRRKPEDFAASLSADVLDTVHCFNMEKQSARPLWISLNIPGDAQPGLYTSRLKISACGVKPLDFEFQVEVLPRVLPPPAKWKFHLDLWQNPYAVARVYGVKPWSEEHWKALKPLMAMLADAGQKVITVSLNKRPWGGQTEDPFGGMISWKKNAGGIWSYDYAIFDRWVEFMMGLGIRDQINCYSMVPWGNNVYYFDAGKNEEVEITAKPGTKIYEEIWTPFLKAFYAHLKNKGWDRITRIAMDERGPEEMKAMLSLLARVSPGLTVALADNHKSYKLYPDQLNDLCVSFGSTVDEEDLRYRKSKGYISTFYTSCSHKFPNVFTFSPPAEAGFIGWYAVAAGFDGYLRWAYCSWVKDPLHDSRFRTWPAGDTYFVYPGPRSSIRFECLREGIQDAEKIRILRGELEREGDAEALEKLKKLNDLVARFNVLKRPENFESMFQEARKKLNELSEN